MKKEFPGLFYFFSLLTLFTASCSSLRFEDSSFDEVKYTEPRFLIVTADDFGASENINAGIRHGIQYGIINSVAAMVTFPHATDDIIRLRKDFPEIEIGLHLSLTSGTPILPPEEIPSLVNPEGNFYSIDETVCRLSKIDLAEAEKELRAQTDCFLKNGIPVASLSSQHNLLGLYTPFFEIMLKIAEENNIPMRSCIPCSMSLKEFSHAKTKKQGLSLASLVIKRNLPAALAFAKYGSLKEMKSNQKKMEQKKIRHPDYLADVFWGEPTPENLYKILKNLPPGTGEIVFHLGLNETKYPIPPGVDGNYYQMREFELLCVTSPEIPRWFKKMNIHLSSFKDLK